MHCNNEILSKFMQNYAIMCWPRRVSPNARPTVGERDSYAWERRLLQQTFVRLAAWSFWRKLCTFGNTTSKLSYIWHRRRLLVAPRELPPNLSCRACASRRCLLLITVSLMPTHLRASQTVSSTEATFILGRKAWITHTHTRIMKLRCASLSFSTATWLNGATNPLPRSLARKWTTILDAGQTSCAA